MMHTRPASQTNQNEIGPPHYYSGDIGSRPMQHLAHSEASLYKNVATSFADSTGMLATSDAPLLQPFHPSGNMQHLNYSQSQQPISQPAVSMSRLNPKAPDFSVTMQHQMPLKQPPMYNGYLMSNQNNSGMYPLGMYSTIKLF